LQVTSLHPKFYKRIFLWNVKSPPPHYSKTLISMRIHTFTLYGLQAPTSSTIVCFYILSAHWIFEVVVSRTLPGLCTTSQRTSSFIPLDYSSSSPIPWYEWTVGLHPCGCLSHFRDDPSCVGYRQFFMPFRKWEFCFFVFFCFFKA
jgi:hypothetical protein